MKLTKSTFNLFHFSSFDIMDKESLRGIYSQCFFISHKLTDEFMMYSYSLDDSLNSVVNSVGNLIPNNKIKQAYENITI